MVRDTGYMGLFSHHGVILLDTALLGGVRCIGQISLVALHAGLGRRSNLSHRPIFDLLHNHVGFVELRCIVVWRSMTLAVIICRHIQQILLGLRDALEVCVIPMRLVLHQLSITVVLRLHHIWIAMVDLEARVVRDHEI